MGSPLRRGARSRRWQTPIRTKGAFYVECSCNGTLCAWIAWTSPATAVESRARCRRDRPQPLNGAWFRVASSSSKRAKMDARSTAIATTNCRAPRCKTFAACSATVCAVAAARKTVCRAASARSAIAIASASTPTTAARSAAPAATSKPAPRCKPAANAARSAAIMAVRATCASTARRCAAVTRMLSPTKMR